jgi:hypothetical protein
MDSLAGQYGKDLAIISAPALELRNLVAVVVLSNAKRKGTDNKD